MMGLNQELRYVNQKYYLNSISVGQHVRVILFKFKLNIRKPTYSSYPRVIFSIYTYVVPKREDVISVVHVQYVYVVQRTLCFGYITKPILPKTFNEYSVNQKK